MPWISGSIKWFEGLSRFLRIQIVAITVLTLISAYTFIGLDISIYMPLEIFSVAVLVPTLFLFLALDARRRDAKREFAAFKGKLSALYYAHRDWPDEADNKSLLGIRTMLHEMAADVCKLVERRRYMETDELVSIHKYFSNLSKRNEGLRARGVSTQEVDRANGYLADMMLSFDKIVAVLQSPLPPFLNTYCRLLLNAMPIVLGPYYEYQSDRDGLLTGYFVAICLSVLFVGLDTIRQAMESSLYQDFSEEFRIAE